MSNSQPHNSEHSSPIKTPRQLITLIVLAFIVPILIIMLLVHFVVSGTKPNAGSDTLSPDAISARIAPVAGLDLRDESGPKVFKTGEEVYKAVCATCHATGVANAPIFGNNASFAKAIQEGYETMLSVALNGRGAMPAKGGNPSLDDFEVARAVVYMANNSGGNFEEPAEPAAEGEEAAQ